MSTPRIPREISKFNTYIVNSNNRQLAVNSVTTKKYWEDYGWTLAQSNSYTTDWHDEWVNNVYPKYSNPATSTSIVKADTNKFIEDFVAFTHEGKLLDKIVSCGTADNTDAAIWNVDLERADPSGPPVKINSGIFADVSTRGRGKFEVNVRAEADSSRSSIPRDAGADCVQYAMAVVTKPEDAVSDPNSKSLTKDLSKKAHFELDAGSENQAKWLCIYFRWYNTSYPKIAGDWSVMTLVAIG